METPNSSSQEVQSTGYKQVVAVISLIVTTILSSQIGKLASVVNFGALSSFLFLHVSVMNYDLRKL